MRRDRREHPRRGGRELDNDEPRKTAPGLRDDERSLICVPGGFGPACAGRASQGQARR